MTAQARRKSLSQEITSAVRRRPKQPQAPAAGASVLGHAGAHRVGAVAADEPPVLVGDHRTEVDARHAMGAADGQGCVGQSWHRALLHMSKEGWHAGFQTPCRVMPLKDKGFAGSHTGSEPKPTSRFRQACRQAGRSAGDINAQPSSASDEKTKAPRTIWVTGRRSNSP